MKKYFEIALGVMMIGSLSSCLKDDLNFDPEKSPSVIEFANISTPASGNESTYPLYTASYPIAPSDTHEVVINYAGNSAAPQDISVGVELAPDVIAAYNDENGSTFTNMPATFYEVLTPTVVIKKGERKASVLVKLFTDKFDLSANYALAFRIKSVSSGTISGNYGAAVFGLKAKNKYDKLYHATGIFIHPTAGERAIDEDKQLQTVTANSVICNLGDLGSSGYRMILTVNANNTVTITKAGATPNVDMSYGPNTYDPATETFTLNYAYNTAAPRIIREKIAVKK